MLFFRIGCLVEGVGVGILVGLGVGMLTRIDWKGIFFEIGFGGIRGGSLFLLVGVEGLRGDFSISLGEDGRNGCLGSRGGIGEGVRGREIDGVGVGEIDADLVLGRIFLEVVVVRGVDVLDLGGGVKGFFGEWIEFLFFKGEIGRVFGVFGEEFF